MDKILLNKQVVEKDTKKTGGRKRMKKVCKTKPEYLYNNTT